MTVANYVSGTAAQNLWAWRKEYCVSSIATYMCEQYSECHAYTRSVRGCRRAPAMPPARRSDLPAGGKALARQGLASSIGWMDVEADACLHDSRRLQSLRAPILRHQGAC